MVGDDYSYPMNERTIAKATAIDSSWLRVLFLYLNGVSFSQEDYNQMVRKPGLSFNHAHA